MKWVIIAQEYSTLDVIGIDEADSSPVEVLRTSTKNSPLQILVADGENKMTISCFFNHETKIAEMSIKPEIVFNPITSKWGLHGGPEEIKEISPQINFSNYVRKFAINVPDSTTITAVT